MSKGKSLEGCYIVTIVGLIILGLIVAQALNRNNREITQIKDVNVNGISQTEVVSYPNETVYLRVNGQNNNITIAGNTLVSRIDLNGLGNVINLCSGIHSPEIYKNGESNRINYLNC